MQTTIVIYSIGGNTKSIALCVTAAACVRWAHKCVLMHG